MIVRTRNKNVFVRDPAAGGDAVDYRLVLVVAHGAEVNRNDCEAGFPLLQHQRPRPAVIVPALYCNR